MYLKSVEFLLSIKDHQQGWHELHRNPKISCAWQLKVPTNIKKPGHWTKESNGSKQKLHEKISKLMLQIAASV